jgi:rhamnosyltransferase
MDGSKKIDLSIIIRTFNEEEHIKTLLSRISIQKTRKKYEIIVVDSGSTDQTLEIIEEFDINLVQISPDDFTFGYSLNKGIESANGNYYIIISAHCYPADELWLENILKPFSDKKVALVYGKQRGGDTTKFSENRIFMQWFPEENIDDYRLPFANNANSAIRRSVWEKIKFNEKLTGLEDMDWVKNVKAIGYSISYRADAFVYHIHNESRTQIYRRYYREANAYMAIYPGEKFYLFDLIKFITLNIYSDYILALGERELFKNIIQITIYRVLQFWGTYRAHQSHVPISKEMQRKLYYPENPNIFNKSKNFITNFFKNGYKVYDISRPCLTNDPVWPGSKPLDIEWLKNYADDGVNESSISLNSHSGTHIDMPYHLIPSGKRMKDLPLESMIGPALVIEYLGSESVNMEFLKKKMHSKKAKRILLKTMNSFDKLNNGTFNKNFVAITKECARWIVENGIKLVGIDGPSIQSFFDTDNSTHKTLLEANTAIVEGLDLSKVSEGIYTLVALPLNISETEGAPLRAVLIKSKVLK